MKLQYRPRNNLSSSYTDTVTTKLNQPHYSDLKSNVINIFEIGYLCGACEEVGITEAIHKVFELQNSMELEVITPDERTCLFMALLNNCKIDIEDAISQKLHAGSFDFIIKNKHEPSKPSVVDSPSSKSSINNGNMRKSRIVILAEEENGVVTEKNQLISGGTEKLKRNDKKEEEKKPQGRKGTEEKEKKKVQEQKVTEEKRHQEQKRLDEQKRLEQEELETRKLIDQLLCKDEEGEKKRKHNNSVQKEQKTVQIAGRNGFQEERKKSEERITFKTDFLKDSTSNQELWIQMENDRFMAEELNREADSLRLSQMGVNCDICMESLYSKEFIAVSNCPHLYHRECLHPFVKEAITSKRAQIKCPDQKCPQILTPQDIEEILDGDDLDRYQTNQLDLYIANHQKDISYCPTLGCNYPFEHSGVSEFECPKCWNHYCLDCRVEYHVGKSCTDFKRDRVNNTFGKADEEFMQFVKGANFKQCGNCKHWIERKEGCPHMTCRCGYQFCYRCGGRWGRCPCPP